MDIENNKQRLTPNEVNKFTYCPYQWYYERLYGRKKLNELAKERNLILGREDKRLSNFNKGNAFHSSAHFKTEAVKIVFVAIAVIVITFIIILKVKNVI